VTRAEAAAVAHLNRIADALERIADALERIAAGVERATTIEPAPTGCLHPPDWRIEFGGMQGADEWECSTKLGGCGYRYPRDLQSAATETTGRE